MRVLWNMLVGVALVSIVALAPTPSEAILTGSCSGSLEGLGECSKTVTFDALTDTLTITLENTSPAANGGFITADAFDLTGDVSVLSFATTNANFSIEPDPPSSGGQINVSPFGEREFVISTDDGDWEGGGAPQGGIGVGESATFTLVLDGDITEASMFGNNEAIRFRGFEDGGSDKTTTTTQVPEPGTLLLVGAGLIGTALMGRRHRKS